MSESSKVKYQYLPAYLIAGGLVLVLTLVFGNSTKFVYVPKADITEVITDDFATSVDSIFSIAQQKLGFNGSVLVAKKGKVLYQNQYGFADPVRKIPFSDSSGFQLASVTKQFTAAAVLKLIEERKLKLDDKMVKYIPELPYPEITIKHLLNHTSGLPIYFWYSDHAWEADTAPSNDDMIKTMGQTVLQPFFSPGQKFEYSNTGYFILASIVERVTGKTYSDFLNEKFFKPLLMNNTFVYQYPKEENKNQLWGYKQIYRGRYAKIPAFTNDGVVGDKNIFSTAEDLFKWTFALNNGLVLEKNLVDLMYTPGITNSGWETPYGMGFRIDRDNDGTKRIYHNGRWNGFMNALQVFPENQLWFIVLTNNNFKAVPQLVLKTKRLFIKREI